MLRNQKGFYTSEKLSRFPGLVHGFSTRELGDMKFGVGGREKVVQNRKKLAQAMGFGFKRVVEAEQIHGSRVVAVDETDFGREVRGVDGLVTGDKEIFLLVKTADCIPALVFDPVQKVVGAVHAGWKGVLAKIGSKTVELMRSQFGCQEENILVGLGPAIGGCCYSVSQERASAFKDLGEEIIWEREGKPYLDLKKALGQELVQAGLLPENIEVSDLCTQCQNQAFFSFRQEGKKLAGEMAAVIGIKEER